ncbi:MAG: homoserine dehydrogenase [Alphaproteobacteria bacterium]
MRKALRIGVAGLGTVGIGVVRLLRAQASLLEARAGIGLEIVAVSARDKGRDRGADLSGMAWHDDPVALAESDDIDVFIELIGGSEGPARLAVEAALKAGKPVVTANKALVAHHGMALAKAAGDAGVALAYEAAVAGGIPVIKAIREGLVGNRLSSVQGILNGTCNYILTTMRDTGRAFDDVLGEAQQLGYAEADPGFDVDGVDAAHKLAILASLAFGSVIDFDSVYIEGIRAIGPDDMAYAEEFGLRIKLLGIAEDTPEGVIQRVHPVMIPETAPLAAVEGVFNAVVTEGDFVGTSVLEGRGAGEGPTASAVVADIVDIACGRARHAFGVPVDRLVKRPSLPISRHVGAYYLRLVVFDRPGVMADITAALRDNGVSLENVIQRGHDPEAPVTVVLTMHETDEASLLSALERIGELDSVVEKPHMIRIEGA